jgi:heterodisulfide reductase subunit B
MVKKYKDDVTIPILYFSQLIGLALGLSKNTLGFSRSIIDLKTMWEKIETGGRR